MCVSLAIELGISSYKNKYDEKLKIAKSFSQNSLVSI